MSDRPLRVILNDRCLRNPRTGVGHYVSQLLEGFRNPRHGIAVIAPYTRLRGMRPAGAASPGGGGSGGGRWPTWARRVAQGAYDAAFEVAAAAGRFDLFHEPNFIPAPFNGPIVTTIHDLSVLRHPEWHPADRVDWYSRAFAQGLSRTNHVIAVSEFTRSEIVSLLDVPPHRITVIPLAARAMFHPRLDEPVRALRARLKLPETFVLFVGTLEPRKNLPGALAAYARLRPDLRERCPLVLAGVTGWMKEPVESLAARHGVAMNLRLLGYVVEEDLALLYNAASVLLWPTLYEGFGLPPLECMASGTPVITSHVASLPEVVGDAGILLEPHDETAIAAALERVLEDKAYRAELIARGLEQARHFSWEACVAQHAEVYRRVAP